MTTVQSILRDKGNTVWTIAPNALVVEALALMADKNIGALVVAEGGRVVGIFSERDYARKIVLKGKSSQATTVREIMSTDIVSISPAQSIEDCMVLMTSRNIRHLPVLLDGILLGLVSIGDVVKATLQEHEQVIEHLTNYIAGTR